MVQKILMVANSSMSIIKFRSGLIKELGKIYHITVLAPRDIYSAQITALGCTFEPITTDNKGSNPLKDALLTIKLIKLYKQIKPDLIFHYTIKPVIYGTLAARYVKCNNIAIIPGLGYIFINAGIVSYIAKLLYRISLRFANKVFFINEDDRSEFVNHTLVHHSKTLVLPGEGVNIDYFSPQKIQPKSTFVFLLIARILGDKGIREYAQAAHLLQKKYPHMVFQILGELSPQNPSAIPTNEFYHWVDTHIISYIGTTTDVRSHIAYADVIVLPSYREGKGMVLMEAACMEKPIIATNVSGCRDIIQDGYNGYLCQLKSGPDLAHTMEKMYLLPPLQRTKMGQRGRQKMIQECSEHIVIDKYIQVITEIL